MLSKSWRHKGFGGSHKDNQGLVLEGGFLRCEVCSTPGGPTNVEQRVPEERRATLCLDDGSHYSILNPLTYAHNDKFNSKIRTIQNAQ